MPKRQKTAAQPAPAPAGSEGDVPSSRPPDPYADMIDALVIVGETLANTGSLDGRCRGALRGTCRALRQALDPCARLAAADLVKLTDGAVPESCVELRVDGKLKTEYAGYLVGADWARLESLRIEIVSDALPMLARKKFPKLRRLKIDCIEGYNANFESLKRIHATQLEELHVAGAPGGSGRGGAAVAARLAEVCTALRRLTLRSMGLTHEAAEGILKVRTLRSLDLSDNLGLADGIGALIAENENNLPGLCELVLESAKLRKVDLEKLRETRLVSRRIKHLALGLWASRQPDDAAEVPDAMDIVSLLDALSGNVRLTDLALSLPRGQDAASAFQGATLRTLRSLRLTSVDSPAALFAALGRATLPALHSLHVAGPRGDARLLPTGSLDALAAPEALPCLEELTLRYVTMGHGVANTIRELFGRLKVARLEAMSITDAEMDQLFKSMRRPRRANNNGGNEAQEEEEERWALEELSLSHNGFKSQGLAQLMAAAPYMPSLRSLRVLHCKYSTSGTRFLLAAATAVFPNVVELGIDVNKDAAAVLAEGWRWLHLDALEFTHSNVTDQGLLREAFPGVRVTFA